jgi:hypothetical protein
MNSVAYWTGKAFPSQFLSLDGGLAAYFGKAFPKQADAADQ